MTSLSSSKDLPKLASADRRLALAFGALILAMLVAVLLAGGLYVRGSIEREQSRLSALTSQVLANAVSRISFSGKHHARLLLEEIKAAQPGILYLRLVDGSGVIQAHSDASQNGRQVEAQELPLIRPVLDGARTQQDRRYQLDGVPVREVSIAYRGGYDNADISVLQLGISELDYERDLARGTWFLAFLILGLLLLGILVTWRISAHFGKPVRQLVRTLEHEQALMRTLISTLPDLVWVKDAEGVYLACNRRFEDFFGAGERDIVGKTDFDFVAAELAESFRKNDLVAMANERPSSNEEEIVFASDGHRETLETTKASMRNEQGQLIGVLGIGHDISERKRAELALRRSQDVLLALLQQAPVPMSYSPVSEGGRLDESYWNRAWYSSFGYAQGSKEGVPGGAFGLWAQAGQRNRYVQDVIDEGLVEGLEANLLDASGQVRICEVWGSLIDAGHQRFVMTTYIDVTQKRVDALHLKEFEAMVQNADDAMLFIDQGRITAANLAVERLFGVSAPAVVGLSPVDLSPPYQSEGRSSAQAAEHYLGQALAKGSQRFLWQHCRSDGSLFLAQVALSAVEGYSGRLVAVVRDVTDEQNAARSLARSEARFKSIIAVSNTGAWEYHGDSNYLWCSQEYFTMLGRDPAAFPMDGRANLQTTWLDLLHPEDLERAREQFAQYLDRGSVGMYENQFRMRHADGSWVWIWSRGQTLRNADGSVSDVTLGTHINITGQKRSEEQLRESQQRLETISNNLPSSMVYQIDCGEDGSSRQFTYLSEGVEHLHGLARVDVMRDAKLLYRQIHPDDLEALALQEAKCVASLSDFNTEYRGRGPAGDERWFFVTSTPRRQANRRIVFDGIEIDITERKQAQRELQLLNQTLETRVSQRTAELSDALDHLSRTQQELIQSEKLAALGSLVAGVAHELNTPIGNAVTVASAMLDAHHEFSLRMDAGLTRTALKHFVSTVGEGVDILTRNLQRAADLVTSFKQLSVDQSGHLRRVFDLKDVIGEVQVVMSPALRKAQVSVQVQVPDDIQLDSYPGALTQVLMILLSNALTHAFNDRADGRVTIGASTGKNGRVTVSVADNGVGIPEEHLSRVFEPFFTTRLGTGGSGLGLHILFNIVSGTLGGTVEVHSKPGEGATFLLDLPLLAPSPKSGPQGFEG